MNNALATDNSKTFTVLIVNDSSVLTSVIRATVETQPNLKVVATATNGAEAILRTNRYLPDLILMDIHMPKMDGVEATRRIIQARPKTRILITTATITRNMRHIFEALEHGALDYSHSPSLNFRPGTEVSAQQLIHAGRSMLEKIREVTKISEEKTLQHSRRTPVTTAPAPAPYKRSTQPLRLLAIGCSTGGPRVVAEILKRLRHPFPAPIVVCIHIDSDFTEGFASWLREQTGFPCSIARHQGKPESNHVYIAPGGKNNLELSPGLRFLITPPQAGQHFLLNINQLFSSISKSMGNQACGVVLTGLGDDGASGIQQLHQSGSLTLAQDDASATVDSMPRAARIATGQDRGYPPAQLAQQINSHF
jgi:chemotaxis response regulator CheB